MRFVGFLLVVPFGVALALAGCASSPGADSTGSDDESLASESELRAASCGHYSAFFADRSCPTVQGKRGHWEPEPLFDGPEDVRDKSCSYRWVPTATAKPDTKALTAATRDESNVVIGAVAPMCGASSDPVVVDPHEVAPEPFHPQLGSVGCDVCGVIRGGKGWVVVPPNFPSPTFPVDLTNGDRRQFALPGNVAGAVEVRLPTPPAGASYVDGPIHLK